MNDIPSGYYVADDGTISNIKTGRTLKPGLSGDGYLTARLYKNGLGKTVKIHRLVAKEYVPNPDNKPQVNHIDGNKLNNHYTNLEWVTRSENMSHAAKLGLNPSGDNHYRSYLCVDDIRDIRRLRGFGEKAKVLATTFNTSLANIYQILQNRSWKNID